MRRRFGQERGRARCVSGSGASTREDAGAGGRDRSSQVGVGCEGQGSESRPAERDRSLLGDFIRRPRALAGIGTALWAEVKAEVMPALPKVVVLETERRRAAGARGRGGGEG